VVGLGPIGVLPAAQGRGVGTALMYALLGAAQAGGETLVGLLGEPAYYGRFGVVAATDVGITPPDPGWGRYFQVLVAGGRSSTGPFRYAAPFDDLV
jgi:putative acetyltransferase